MKTVILTCLIMLSTIALAGCGGVEWERPAPAKFGEKSPAPEPTPAEQDPAEAGEATSDQPAADGSVVVTTTTTTKVTVPGAVTTQATANLAPWIYEARKSDYDTAVERTPKGYRMATVGEVNDLIEHGELLDYADGLGVWTSSPSTVKTAVKCIDIRTGQTFAGDKGFNGWPTIYVRAK